MQSLLLKDFTVNLGGLMTLNNQLESPFLSAIELSQFIDELTSSMNLTLSEIRNLQGNPIAHLIAEAPYMANESNPDQVAVLGLSAYILISRNKKRFNHRDSQPLRERVALCVPFINGEQEVREAVLDILEEASLMDHLNDSKTDLTIGKPNPINSGIINFQKEKNRLTLKRTQHSERVKTLLSHTNLSEIFAGWWMW